jgi:retron-type reverse transcriptase
VARRIADPHILKLIRSFLKSGIMDQGKLAPSEEGTPQGSLCKALHNPPYAKWKTMQSKGKKSLKLLHFFPIYFA